MAWCMPYVTGKTYRVWWTDVFIDWVNMSCTLSDLWETTDSGITFVHPYVETRAGGYHLDTKSTSNANSADAPQNTLTGTSSDVSGVNLQNAEFLGTCAEFEQPLCTETASVSVAEDAALCAAVTGPAGAGFLADCEAVMTTASTAANTASGDDAADPLVRACTHTDHVSVAADAANCSAITGTDLET